MLVSGAGDIKITKDGKVLLEEMQIQHPTAQMVARTVTAQDDMTGDGSNGLILFIHELMKQAEWYTSSGVHPRVITEGYELAAAAAIEFIEEFKTPVPQSIKENREVYVQAARSSLGTKLDPILTAQLSEIVTDAVACVTQPNQAIDLHMVEVMTMQHKLGTDTRFVSGLVLDHGPRHADMPKELKNCYILTCNIGLEWDNSEINSEWNYSNVGMKEKMARAERKNVEDRAQEIINLKRQLCTPENGKNFVVINQKGMDPYALDLLAREHIIGLRRAKRRNMERLVLACGGTAVNHMEGIEEKDLGWAESVQVHTLGEDQFTFVEGVKNPASCTILIKGPNKHTIERVKDAVRDGLRAVKNVAEDGAVLRGAGAFEVACSNYLKKVVVDKAEGRAKVGVQAFAEALLFVPRTLAENSGLTVTDLIVDLQSKHNSGNVVGVNIENETPIDPAVQGIFDTVLVKSHAINAAATIAIQLLLVDEIMKASTGKRGGMKKDAEAEDIAGD
jgi:T-complex protein 1 subunit zeta